MKVLANDPGGAVLVHLGSSDFLSRYKIYVSHVQGWRQQFDKLESVDLRYEHQIIVNPDNQNMAKAPPITPAAAKAAMAAGVKNAALIHVIPAKKTAIPTVALVKTDKAQWEKVSYGPPVAKPATAKPAPKKATHHKTKPKPHAKKAPAKTAPRPAAKSAKVEPSAKPAAKAPAKSAANAAQPASGKKKPSAAVAKNHDQQDHP